MLDPEHRRPKPTNKPECTRVSCLPIVYWLPNCTEKIGLADAKLQTSFSSNRPERTVKNAGNTDQVESTMKETRSVQQDNVVRGMLFGVLQVVVCKKSFASTLDSGCCVGIRAIEGEAVLHVLKCAV